MRTLSLAFLLLFSPLSVAAESFSLPIYAAGFLDRQSISLSGQKLQPVVASAVIGTWLYEGIALEAELGVGLSDDNAGTLAVDSESQLAVGIRFESAPIQRCATAQTTRVVSMSIFRQRLPLLLCVCLTAACDSGNEADALRNRVTVATLNYDVAEVRSKHTVLEAARSYTLEFWAGTEVAAVDHSAEAFWTSSDPSVATVTGLGVVNALTDGNVTITGEFGSLNGSVDLRVSSAPLTSISVVAPSDMNECDSVQLTATGLFAADNDSERDISDTVVWGFGEDSGSVGVFNDAAPGLFRSSGTGTAIISASRGEESDQKTGTATIAIADNLQGFTLSPSSPTLTTRASTQFNVSAMYDNVEATPVITDNVLWSVSGNTTAIIDNALPDKGLFTTSTNGDVTLKVKCGSADQDYSFLVGDPAVVERIKFENPDDPFEFNFNGPIVIPLRAFAVLETRVDVEITEEVDWLIVERDSRLLSVSNDAGSRGQLTVDGRGSITVRIRYDLDNNRFDEDASVFNEPTLTITAK